MYDWVLGGAANFEADRRAGERALEFNPQGRLQAQANRAFLRRVVRHLAHAGIDQFVDLGSGVPTVDHVHQVAQRVNPDARVVYVDSDPVASAYGASLLARDDIHGAVMVRADLRDIDRIRHDPGTQALIDWTQPVAILMVAVLHFLMDDTEVSDVIAAYRAHTVPGSRLAISHMTGDDPHLRDLQRLYQHTTMPFRTRTPDQITALFSGYQLLAPGVTVVSDWHPDPGPDPNRPTHDAFAGAVGQRP
jgi:O-methyltransferase involved in polyketide biosynthesis